MTRPPLEPNPNTAPPGRVVARRAVVLVVLVLLAVMVGETFR